MFSNIPPKHVLQIFDCYFKLKNSNPLFSRDFLNLLDICLKQNYFKFGGNIYKMDRGLIMGSAISPLAADMFMDFLEGRYIMSRRNPYRKYIEFWGRYCDDIICSFTGSLEDLRNLHKYLNSCHQTIKFTLEIESEGKLCFLDLEIEREGSRHKFGIYRKPSATDLLIPADSHHHPQYKRSGILFLIDRLLNVPLDECSYNTELGRIKQIAHSNGYCPSLVDKILGRRLKRKFLTEEEIGTRKKKKDGENVYHLSIPYLGPISEKIGRKLKKIGITTAFKSKTSLQALLPRVKDPVEPLDKSGVYAIACADCESSYVGQSGRKIRTRLKEHLTRDTEFSQHVANQNHTKTELRFQLLQEAPKGRKLDLLEGLYIKLEMLRNKSSLNKHCEVGRLRHVTGESLEAIRSRYASTPWSIVQLADL